MAVKINKIDLLGKAGKIAETINNTGMAQSEGGVVENDWLKLLGNLKGAMTDIKEIFTTGKEFIQETGLLKKKEPSNAQQFDDWTQPSGKVIDVPYKVGKEEKSKEDEPMKWDFNKIKLAVGLACKLIGEDKTLKDLKDYVDKNEETIKGLLS